MMSGSTQWCWCLVDVSIRFVYPVLRKIRVYFVFCSGRFFEDFVFVCALITRENRPEIVVSRVKAREMIGKRVGDASMLLCAARGGVVEVWKLVVEAVAAAGRGVLIEVRPFEYRIDPPIVRTHFPRSGSSHCMGG